MICRRFRFLLSLLLYCFFSDTSFARFDRSDADQVDQEERINGAAFHDANTYRFYPRFNRLWDSKDIGYRISDGSYDADRSRIHEQIKASTSVEDFLWFAYTGDHYHDVADKLTFDEIRLAWKPMAGVYAAGLADGNSSYKQWGDLGAAVGWLRDRSSYFEFYRWSVDHFYNSKAEVDLGVYRVKPTTSGFRMSWQEPEQFSIQAVYEVDKLFRWERFDCNCEYEYKWWRGDYKIQVFPVKNLTFEVKGYTSEKHEEKTWDDGSNRYYTKGLERRANLHDLSALWDAEDFSYYQLGLVRIQRHADYEFEFTNIPANYTFLEDASADATHRESIGYLFYNVPISDDKRYFFQTGYTQNWVNINRELSADDIAGKDAAMTEAIQSEFEDETAIEQKMQIAFELHFRTNLWLFLNATLDVDGIRKEFPYKESPTPGNIWDGGGVQVMAVF